MIFPTQKLFFPAPRQEADPSDRHSPISVKMILPQKNHSFPGSLSSRHRKKTSAQVAVAPSMSQKRFFQHENHACLARQSKSQQIPAAATLQFQAVDFPDPKIIFPDNVLSSRRHSKKEFQAKPSNRQFNVPTQQQRRKT